MGRTTNQPEAIFRVSGFLASESICSSLLTHSWALKTHGLLVLSTSTGPISLFVPHCFLDSGFILLPLPQPFLSVTHRSRNEEGADVEPTATHRRSRMYSRSPRGGPQSRPGPGDRWGPAHPHRDQGHTLRRRGNVSWESRPCLALSNLHPGLRTQGTAKLLRPTHSPVPTSYRSCSWDSRSPPGSE